MAKAWVNRSLNSLLYVGGCGLVLTGTLQEWVLPGGPERRGLSWLGWRRHDWAELHSWLAWISCGAVLLHLVLHWAWIRAFLFGEARRRGGWLWLGLALLLLGGALGLPFAIPPQEAPFATAGLGPGPGGPAWRGGR